jgi:hypothetical protein
MEAGKWSTFLGLMENTQKRLEDGNLAAGSHQTTFLSLDIVALRRQPQLR